MWATWRGLSSQKQPHRQREAERDRPNAVPQKGSRASPPQTITLTRALPSRPTQNGTRSKGSPTKWPLWMSAEDTTAARSATHVARMSTDGSPRKYCIYRPLSGIGISYGIFSSLLCDFNPELWQVHLTILAYFCLILGFGSLNKCYTSETRSHNYGWQLLVLALLCNN
jgi:hypothetical protein